MDSVPALGGRRAPPPRVVIVMGPAGCGKTTLGSLIAERLQWEFLDADDLHPVGNVEKMRQGFPLSEEDRQPWLEAVCAHIVTQCPPSDTGSPAVHDDSDPRARRGLVVACSALKRTHRKQLCQTGQPTLFVCLHVPAQELAARLEGREGHFASVGLLQSQLDTLQRPDDVDRRLGIAFVELDGTQDCSQLVERLCRTWEDSLQGPRWTT